MTAGSDDEPGDTGANDLALSSEEFDAFHDAHGRALWGYVLRSTGDEHLASDIFQETLLRFLRSAPRDLDDAKRRAYVFRIASNLMRDAWRAGRREERWRGEEADEASIEKLYGETANDSTLAQPHMVLDSAERIALSRDLDRALRTLRPIERQLVWLAHVEGLSHRELGNMLGLEESSVKVMLFRARKKLAASLTPEPVGRGGSR